MTTTKPMDVAIIGGGCAGMATAFELTRPELEGKYRVTVYQLGFRLGGKGASGRGDADRIEEHGLHLWMGFYENAFRLMRECYAEAARDPRTCRIADWRDAFFPDNFNAVADQSSTGVWLPWKVHFTPLPGLPGDPHERVQSWTVGDYLMRTAVLTRTLFQSIGVKASGSNTAERAYPTMAPAIAEGIANVLRIGRLTTMAALVEALRFVELAVATLDRDREGVLLRLIDLVIRESRAQLDALVSGDDAMRRLWDVIELTLATMRGIVRHQLLTDPRGFDAIDDYDCRAWLKLHGASDRAINSAYIRALYDLAFAYEDGDVERPRMAAGQAVRGTLRAFFTYRGAFFWKMASGMGDVVFAPLYEVLKQRGVRFEFFHRLENVRVAHAPGDPRPHVSALEFAIQADLRDGMEYKPLVSVRGLPCWPAAPDFSQLVGGDEFRREARDFESHWDLRCVRRKALRVGEDFDFVVLAIGLGAVQHACSELIASDPVWAQMVESVKTVSTQALQLWLRKDTRELGWQDEAVNISGFVEPFDTWADMSHLIREESHAERVRSIAYFCSVLPEPRDAAAVTAADYPEQRLREARAAAIQFLNRDIRHLWPNAVQAGQFRWELLVAADASPVVAERGIETQYVRVNVNPSDRYALSLPGSIARRISPLDHTYDNLTVAGDWTRCSFNAGCVEAAVMSGRLAAHAISGSPALEEIVGFDHP